MCMTRLNMYDIIKENLDKDLEKSIEIKLDYNKEYKFGGPKVRIRTMNNNPNQIRLFFSEIPLELNSGRIDHNIFKHAINKTSKVLLEKYDREDFRGKSFELSNFEISIIPWKINRYKVGEQNIVTPEHLSFNIFDFLPKKLLDQVYYSEHTDEDFFSGNLFGNIEPNLMSKMDMDFNKWYDIEFKKVLTAMKHLLKGKVDGLSYEINPQFVNSSVWLRKTLYKESDNTIHPDFRSILNVSKNHFPPDIDVDEFEKIKNHIIMRLKNFGIDEVNIN